MASESRRLLDTGALSSSKSSERTEVLDLGAYNTLEVQYHVLKNATVTGGTPSFDLELQHSAVNEDGTFLSLSGTSVDLTSASSQHVTVSNFLRYVRWSSKLDGSINTGDEAVVGIDLVAKE